MLSHHVLMKVIFRDDAACHDPDCMQTSDAEVKSVFDMAL